MANKINKKSFHERYALLLNKYPKTLEWVRHKAIWEHITLGAVLNGYESYIEELMQQEDGGCRNVKTPDEIHELEDHVRDLTKKIEQLQMENAELSIMFTSAQSAAETWKRRVEAIQRDFGEFAARINTGEDIMGCEYCKKNYAEGECNCNCLKDFEWRGVKEE